MQQTSPTEDEIIRKKKWQLPFGQPALRIKMSYIQGKHESFNRLLICTSSKMNIKVCHKNAQRNNVVVILKALEKYMCPEMKHLLNWTHNSLTWGSEYCGNCAEVVVYRQNICQRAARALPGIVQHPSIHFRFFQNFSNILTALSLSSKEIPHSAGWHI